MDTGLLFLAIISNAAMNTDIQTSLWDSAFNSFGHIARNVTARSYGNDISNF